ncbi:hypothetical protein BpHYR1_019188 [Brachionus plicatilis]|uniref:Uncharacterized protein n=1 Tax=Brachionus plicatilis TaxID=10195 RepID=A0A3M7QQX4_BRAPC|nr:hypothetical protein BpHYR1_019188 [Brachionus plicatilis]
MQCNIIAHLKFLSKLRKLKIEQKFYFAKKHAKYKIRLCKNCNFSVSILQRDLIKYHSKMSTFTVHFCRSLHHMSLLNLSKTVISLFSQNSTRSAMFSEREIKK